MFAVSTSGTVLLPPSAAEAGQWGGSRALETVVKPPVWEQLPRPRQAISHELQPFYIFYNAQELAEGTEQV
jgi:hypothetical protein